MSSSGHQRHTKALETFCLSLCSSKCTSSMLRKALMALFRRRITLICFPAFADAHLCVLTSLDCALIHNTRARLPSIHMALKNSDVVHILEREISVCYDRL